MTLRERLEDSIYWEETLDRMLLKPNLDSEQRMELMLFETLGYKEDFLRELDTHSYNWSIPTKVYLNKLGTKKKRIVYIYSIKDRYILGVLYRVFSAHFSKAVSSNCYSYKRGVKTLTAIDYLRSDSELQVKVGVKLDISAYFNSVNTEYLQRILFEICEGDEAIYYLLQSCYGDNRVVENGSIVEEYKSLTPGTPFSSFLANYCLRDIDDYIANTLQITYARYSDDIIMFSHSREQLEAALSTILDKLKALGLTINEKKYEWFTPGEEIDFLGLKILPSGQVDIGDNSVRKFKKKIKHACVLGKNRIDFEHQDPYRVAVDILGRFNYRTYKCYVQDTSKFGWAYYAFRYVSTPKTLVILDEYLKDRIRQLITGVNNSANIRKVPDSKLRDLGYIPMGEMYRRFREDFDYYCDTVDTLRG